MKKLFTIILLSFLCFFTSNAEETLDTTKVLQPDSVVLQQLDLKIQNPKSINVDSTQVLDKPLTNKKVKNTTIDTIRVEVIEKEAFKPDASRSIWMGTLIPGFGQIANRKYWKLPFVYGGFMGFAYAINWNQRQYIAYKNAYIDITDDDPKTESYLKLLPRGYTLDNFPGGETTFKNRLKSGTDQFHRYRDLSILLSVGFYALVLLDAYVDAQLYDFSISPDLVLNLAPTRLEYDKNKNTAFGLQGSIRF